MREWIYWAQDLESKKIWFFLQLLVPSISPSPQIRAGPVTILWIHDTTTQTVKSECHPILVKKLWRQNLAAPFSTWQWQIFFPLRFFLGSLVDKFFKFPWTWQQEKAADTRRFTGSLTRMTLSSLDTFNGEHRYQTTKANMPGQRHECWPSSLISFRKTSRAWPAARKVKKGAAMSFTSYNFSSDFLSLHTKNYSFSGDHTWRTHLKKKIYKLLKP